MQTDFLKFQQFAKVEETPDGAVVVWGIATQQEPDLDQEVCDYDTAKDVYQAWSDAAAKRTAKAGQEISLGNVRLQHGLDIGGKAIKLGFDDEDKRIMLGSVPLNDQIRDDLRAGFYTGYSQGGSYAWRKCSDCGKSLTLQQSNNWCPDCKKNVTVLYGLKRLSEVSYVDSPCSGVGFEYVKANGSREIVKFAKRSETSMELTQAQIEQIASEVKKKEAKTKRVAGVDLPVHCFAYVGDPEKTETWKLPIEFPGDEEKTKRHIRNALARFSQTQGIPAGEKPKVKAKIIAAAKKHGIDVNEEGESKARQEFMAAINKAAAGNGLAKGLWDVGRLADQLQGLAYLYENSVIERDMEGDDSTVPEELKEILDAMVEVFIASATEEARELAARTDKADTTNKGGSMTPEEMEKAAKKGLAQHFAKKAVHHEKLAATHEKAAASHDEMCDACKAAHEAHKSARKADVESHDAPEAHVAAGDYYKAASDHHKAMKAHHEKVNKAHMAMADHYHKMSESHDKEEHEKAVKAAHEAEPVAAAAAAAVSKTAGASIDDEVATEVERMRNSPEHKAAVAQLAKGRLDAEIESELQKLRSTTLAPDGVQLANTGLSIVPRAGGEQFAFAKNEPSVSAAGI